MTEVLAQRKPSAVEWLNELEARHRPRFAGVSLAIEVDIDPLESGKAVRALGFAYRKTEQRLRDYDGYLRAGDDQTLKALRRWPASVVMAMVGAAASSYDHGSYWPQLLNAAGLPNTQEHQQRFGRAFLSSLDSLDLPPFDHLERRFLGPILMHAGVPNACLADLLNLLVLRREIDPGLDAVAFMAWALDPKVANRLSTVDVPVRNFLHDGGEFALDIVDRTLEVLEYLGDNRTEAARAGLSSATTGLPSSMINHLVDLVADGSVALDRLPSHAQASRARVENPSLAFDWIQGAVLVSLPSVKTDSGRVTWSIGADGEVRTVQANTHWIGSNQDTAATSCTITRPAQRISVTNTDNGRRTDHGLVDPADPLLLFDGDGRFLVPTLPVASDVVWALWPAADAQLVDQAGNEVAFIMEDSAPAGWEGWRVAQVDMSALRALRMDLSGVPGRPHLVRHEDLPVFELAEPTPGLRTVQGSPVYSAAPILRLPLDRHGTVRWDIEVLASGQNRPIVDRRGITAGAGRDIDIFADVEGPLLGTFTVRVRGPLGRRVTRTFSLAEGLAVTCEPKVRLLEGAGLQRAVVKLSPPAGFAVSEGALEFDRSLAEKSVVCSANGVRIPLIVSPPHMEVLVDAEGAPATWIPGIGRLTPDSLGAGSSLMLRLPGQEGAVTLQLRARQGETQTVMPAARRVGAPFRFNLANFADTVKRAGRSDLFAVTGDKVILVATIRPHLQASGAEVFDGGVRLRDYTPAPAVKAAVYADTAPWIKPEICEVEEDGSVSLPAHLGNHGDLSIILAEDDGWGAVEWPRWPIQDRVVAARPGYRESDDQAELELSRLIAEPDTVDRLATGHLVLDKLWSVLSVVDNLKSGAAADRIVSEIRRALIENKDQALWALSGTALPADVSADVLIRSRLLEHAFDSVDNAEEIRQLWTAGVGVAALLAIPTYQGRVAGDVMDELEGDMQMFGGPGLTSITNGEVDPHRETPKFDWSARFLAQKRKSEVDELWRSAQVVPAGLLDQDSRVTVARELFDVRARKEMKMVLTNLPDEVLRLKREIKYAGIQRLNGQVDARLDTGPGAEVWQYLPALSFCYAARARLAARRPDQFGPLNSASRRKWRTLAALAPSFFRMDIILADALIAGSTPLPPNGASQ